MSGYNYEAIRNTLNFAVSLKPSSAFPLDARSMFGSYKEAAEAAASAKPAGSSESIYYYGQRVTVVENDIVSTYLIQVDGTLKAVGATVLGDNKSINIDGGIVSLKSFGIKYYAYKAPDIVIGEYSSIDELPSANDGEYAKIGTLYYIYKEAQWVAMSDDFIPSESSTYVLTDGWKSGLEPKVIESSDGEYELAWYEPSLDPDIDIVTIENVSDSVVDASDDKVISEKLFLDAFTWRTEM